MLILLGFFVTDSIDDVLMSGKIPDEWRKCSIDSDCTHIPFLSFEPINVLFREKAVQAIEKMRKACPKQQAVDYGNMPGCFVHVSIRGNPGEPKCIDGLCTWRLYEPGGCIVAGSMISTPRGLVPIEELSRGGIVLSLDGSGRLSESVIENILESDASTYLLIRLEDGRELAVTSYHPIGTEDGWRIAGDLTVGVSVMTISGKSTATGTIEKANEGRVYDLSVEPHQNYYANGILVHNKTPANPY